MLFDAGSVAKTFEAALALKLAEEGIINLDHSIHRWLPEVPNVDGEITLRQLLNHTSGIFNVFEHPDFPWVGPNVDYTKTWSMEEVFSIFVLEPYGPPCTVQHYSSTNYRLVTEILEIAGGMAVSEQVTQHLLDPLGFEQTKMFEKGAPPADWVVAHPWVDVDRDGQLDDLYGIPVTWKASLTHPVLYATAEDLARWMQVLFNHRSVLSQASLNEMLTYPDVSVPDPEGGTYGLGIVDFTQTLGVQAVGHGGSALGYSAAALYLPEYGVSIAWLVNTGESPYELAAGIMWDTWSALSEVLWRHLEPAS
jgi:D-alanyl-D-alanine carboxypeptidase